MANMQLEHLRSLWYILIYLGHSLVRLHHFQNSGADGDTQSESTTDFSAVPFSVPRRTRTVFYSDTTRYQYGHHGSKAVPSKIPWAKRFRLAGLKRWNLEEMASLDQIPHSNLQLPYQWGTTFSNLSQPFSNFFLQLFLIVLLRATPCSSRFVQDAAPRKHQKNDPARSRDLSWHSQHQHHIVELCHVVSCCVLEKLSTVFQHISTVLDKVILDHWLQIVQFQHRNLPHLPALFNTFQHQISTSKHRTHNRPTWISSKGLNVSLNPWATFEWGETVKPKLSTGPIESNWIQMTLYPWHCVAFLAFLNHIHSNCLGLKRLWASREFVDPPNIQDGIFIERLQGLVCLAILAIAVFRTIAWSVKNEDRLSHGSHANSFFFGTADINIRKSLLLPTRFLWYRRIE